LIHCADFMAEIGNYLEGDVAAEVRAQIESHLAHCQTCQIVYDSARKTVKVLTEPPQVRRQIPQECRLNPGRKLWQPIAPSMPGIGSTAAHHVRDIGTRHRMAVGLPHRPVVEVMEPQRKSVRATI